MDRKFLIVANWKANSVDLPKWFDGLAISEKAPEVAIAPQFPQIPQIPQNFTRVAQNVSSFPSGAFTGEISAQMLEEIGVKYCLIGHSERRKYLHETNDDINLKYESLIKENIIPIVCAQSFEEIPVEILKPLQGKQVQDDTYVMYEPFSAISIQGNYNPESPEIITQTLADWRAKLPERTRFLYGGSVNQENCSLLIAHCPFLSGFVVGHASLDPITFSSVVNSTLQSS